MSYFTIISSKFGENKFTLVPALLLASLLFAACPAKVENVNLPEATKSTVDYSFVVWKEDIPEKMPLGKEIIAKVTLLNNGKLPWISTDDKPYFLSYHWKHPGGRFDSHMFWGERTPLPEYVGVGEMITVDFVIFPPETAKYYDLIVDIVHGEGKERSEVPWFEDLGWKTYDKRIEVIAK